MWVNMFILMYIIKKKIQLRHQILCVTSTGVLDMLLMNKKKNVNVKVIVKKC